jgi:hypothetical protein
VTAPELVGTVEKHTTVSAGQNPALLVARMGMAQVGEAHRPTMTAAPRPKLKTFKRFTIAPIAYF